MELFLFLFSAFYGPVSKESIGFKPGVYIETGKTTGYKSMFSLVSFSLSCFLFHGQELLVGSSFPGSQLSSIWFCSRQRRRCYFQLPEPPMHVSVRFGLRDAAVHQLFAEQCKRTGGPLVAATYSLDRRLPWKTRCDVLFFLLTSKQWLAPQCTNGDRGRLGAPVWFTQLGAGGWGGRHHAALWLWVHLVRV